MAKKTNHSFFTYFFPNFEWSHDYIRASLFFRNFWPKCAFLAKNFNSSLNVHKMTKWFNSAMKHFYILRLNVFFTFFEVFGRKRAFWPKITKEQTRPNIVMWPFKIWEKICKKRMFSFFGHILATLAVFVNDVTLKP